MLGLACGALLKRFVKTAGWFPVFLQKFQLALLLFLLFLMGLRVGQDRGMLHNLPTLGLQSVVIALSSVAGSLLLTFLCVKLFKIHYVTDERYRNREHRS